MKATTWEFEARALIFGLIFGVSFPLYYFDHQNSTAALSQWMAGRLHVETDAIARLLFWAAAVLLVLAAAIRTWASSFLRAQVVYASQVKTEAIAADGPYRYVRNPLYFANILMALGLGAMMSRPGFFVAVLGMVIFCHRLILREEAELAKTQGERYAQYRKAVPRLWPSLRARVTASGIQPQWPDGFRAEGWYCGFALASTVFALTLNVKFFFIILGASLVVFWISSMLMQKKSQSE